MNRGEPLPMSVSLAVRRENFGTYAIAVLASLRSASDLHTRMNLVFLVRSSFAGAYVGEPGCQALECRGLRDGRVLQAAQRV
jgi:hypothetical protein